MSGQKIIFTGPVGAGKSTAIKAVSDIMHIYTEELASDMTQRQKKTTTVALDYGVIQLSDGEKIHLYGTPGQERFNFMWDILTQGGVGLVLLINAAAPDPFGDMRFFITEFKKFIQTSQLVIGISQLDVNPSRSIDQFNQEYQNIAQQQGLKYPVPIFTIDAREKSDINLLIESLLYSLDISLAK